MSSRSMTPVHWAIRLLAVVAGAGVPAIAGGQCVPPANSNEAKLLAFYEAPIVFATGDAPTALAFGHVALMGELVGVPTPSRTLQESSYCYAAKQEGTHLAPVLPRYRVTIGLPAGFAVEGSYLPPVTVDRARPSLGSLALAYTRPLLAPGAGDGPSLALQLRAHGTLGTVRGPITCPASALQQTDPSQPCYGTKPSSDTFYPRSGGGEGSLALQTPNRRFSIYAGTGYTFLSPEFRVGFTNLDGFTDHTLVEVNLNRIAAFGGVSVAIFGGLDVGAQVYSVPVDLTTWRLAVRYRI
jgi:hypothetical protein